jgi:hypothetical protein
MVLKWRLSNTILIERTNKKSGIIRLMDYPLLVQRLSQIEIGVKGKQYWLNF